jgi:oxygen-independent coproporphyrinogen III oxidase
MKMEAAALFGQDLICDGVVEIDGASLALADHSPVLVRKLAAAFDAHLD